MVELKERIEGFCSCSNQDLLLTSRFMDNGKEVYMAWKKASEWDWNIEPTDRQIMANEIVLETDFTEPENKKYSDDILKLLCMNNISTWTYFTTSKSYHTHFVLPGLEKFEDGKYRQLLKIEIAKELIGTDLFSKVDINNFYPKKMIRLEGALNPKTNKRTHLISKYEFVGQDELSNTLITNAIKLVEQREINKIKDYSKLQLENLERQEVYCMLMEDALQNKFPEGGRHMNLCPNAVAILDEPKLKCLCAKQEMDSMEFEGWAKKKPQFNCVQFRRYGASINKQDICKECFKKSFNKYNW